VKDSWIFGGRIGEKEGERIVVVVVVAWVVLLVVPTGCGIEEVASMENWWKGEVGFMVGGSVVDCEDGGGLVMVLVRISCLVSQTDCRDSKSL